MYKKKEPTGEARRCQHKDCIYRTGATMQHIHNCDYTLITGRNRLEGLPKEKWAPCYCDKYEPRKAAGPKKKRAKQIIINPEKTAKPRLSWEEANPEDAEKLRQLHAADMNDREIGEALGWPQATVQYRRDRLGLKPNVAPHHGNFNKKKARELYDQGYNDSEIARAIGNTRRSVANWRKKEGLENNFRQ